MSSVLPELPAKGDPVRMARVFAYMSAVTAGETPAVDPDTAAALAGLARGLYAGLLQRVGGMTPEQSRPAARQWIIDQAALWGSMAATTDREGERP